MIKQELPANRVIHLYGKRKGMVFKQERPEWCPHNDCIFLRSSQGIMCGGKLPKPTEHNGGINTHHFCLMEGHESCYEVNASDLDFFRWIFDALDGKKTSWLSKLSPKV